jgi:hypothetical protein
MNSKNHLNCDVNISAVTDTAAIFRNQINEQFMWQSVDIK